MKEIMFKVHRDSRDGCGFRGVFGSEKTPLASEGRELCRALLFPMGEVGCTGDEGEGRVCKIGELDDDRVCPVAVEILMRDFAASKSLEGGKIER